MIKNMIAYESGDEVLWIVAVLLIGFIIFCIYKVVNEVRNQKKTAPAKTYSGPTQTVKPPEKPKGVSELVMKEKRESFVFEKMKEKDGRIAELSDFTVVNETKSGDLVFLTLNFSANNTSGMYLGNYTATAYQNCLTGEMTDFELN